MEQKLIDYLFDKDYLNFDKIIKDYISTDSDKSYTTFTLLKKVIEDYKTKK